MRGLVVTEFPSDAGGRRGRHVEHDPRSRAFAAERSPAPLRRVSWRRYGRPFDQGSLGSCTGNAIAGVVNTKPFWQPRRILHEPDAVRLYELATALDGFDGTYPPDNTGSSGLAACKAAKQLGLISGYRHAFGIDHALEALQHGPVITGVNWYDGFDTPDVNGLVQIAGEVRGGHEFEVTFYDPRLQLVGGWNSWGPDWGIRGRFYFHVDVWARLLEEDGDVTVPVPV